MKAKKQSHSQRMKDLTPEMVRHIFDYDPTTGVLTWKNPTGDRVCKGYAVKTPDKDGYLIVGLHGMTLRVHRVVFLYMNGEFPCGEVDHINGDPADNRWSNLRLVDRRHNSWNTRLCKTRNTSGVKGVSWCNQKSKWRGLITSGVKYHHVGYFTTLKDAAEAVRIKRIELHGEFANHG